MPMENLGREDAALWGACILAAKGIGLIDDIAAFSEKHILPGDRYEPDPEKHEIYVRLTEQYVRYEKALSPLCGGRLR